MKTGVEITVETVAEISIALGCPFGSYSVDAKRDIEMLLVSPPMPPEEFAAEIDRLNNVNKNNTTDKIV